MAEIRNSGRVGVRRDMGQGIKTGVKAGTAAEVKQIDISRGARTVQSGRTASGRRPTSGSRTAQSGRVVQGSRPTSSGRPASGSRPPQSSARGGQQAARAGARGGTRRRTVRRRRRSSGLGVIAVLLLLVVCIGFYLYGRVEKTYTLEAGTAIQAEKLLSYGKGTPLILEDLTTEQSRTPGEYTVKVKMAPFTHKVKVTVQDTVAPVATGEEVICKYGEELAKEDFVSGIIDGTDVSVAFEQGPDYQKGGLQEIILVLTDEGNNKTRVKASLYISNLMSEITREAGSPVPEARDYLDNIAGFENTEIYYITDPGSIDMSVPGSQEIAVLLDGRECTTTLTVLDTVVPQFTVKHVDGWTLKPIAPETFVKKMTDATAVTYSYVQEPDWNTAGSGSAEIVATDAAGNTSSQTVSFKLKEDKVAPEVSLSTIDIIIGEAVSYKKAVGYSDNADTKAELKLDIDNSKVDPNTVGTYEVVYTVTDTAGNFTSKTGKVFVMAEKPVYYDENVVNEKADEVLASILKDNMTLYEKTKAIYNWVHSKIGYISHSEKGDWVRGAYEGLVKRQGDCFVYACTAKVLLTRAGITNMDIVKSTVNPSHYWNLVDIGDGWYHFDATPRKDKTVFFMWTDEQLREYSESHKNTHIYDKSLYPEIN